MRVLAHFCEDMMSFESKEREWADRTKRFLKAELKRADVTYEELARRLREHGLEETESSNRSTLRTYNAARRARSYNFLDMFLRIYCLVHLSPFSATRCAAFTSGRQVPEESQG